MPTFLINCAEDYSKRSFNISGSLDKKDWRAKRAWTVQSTDPNFLTDGATVTPLPGNDPVPNIGDSHPQYNFMVVDSQNLKATENPTFWEVEVIYKYTFGVTLELSPLMQPPRWRFLVGEESVPWFFDKDGNPIVNSAGDFFDPQPQDVRANLSIRITRFEATYDANKALQFMNSTNSDAWTLPNGQVVQPGQARMHSIEQGQDIDKNAKYVQVVYVAYLTDTDFNMIAVDKGFQSWDLPPGASSPVLEKIYTGTTPASVLSSTAVSSAVLLNGNGAAKNYAIYQLGPLGGSPEPNPYPLSWITRVTTTPGVVGLKYKQLKLQSFNSLGLI